jgi:glycosyltransferase involved in cell wall biosynthesis
MHLTKDIGLIPYTMHKYYDCHSTIVCYNYGNYADLKYLEGVKIDFLGGSGNFDVDISNYLASHSEIDVLFLCGLYGFNYSIIEKYREINPKGRIYLKLDATLPWAERFQLDDEKLKFLKLCDVISVECKELRTYLNNKWPVKVEYLPNGYWGFYEDDQLSYSKKENIILTVGRIGTWQKGTDTLLKAFGEAFQLIPGWRLILVGGIEGSFVPSIQKILAERPGLRDRVVFTGRIDDKNLLKAEYQKAKVFCLPSRADNVCNVLPEAAISGCYIIVSNVDGAPDITSDGTMGDIFAIDNIPQLSEIMVRVCLDEEGLRTNFPKIRKHAFDNFNWVKICHQLNTCLGH